MPNPPILARRRCLNEVPFCGGCNIESMLSWPWEPSAVAGRGLGKLPRASIKGGRSSAADPDPVFGLMLLIPTMMIGTMRPSPVLSPVSLESSKPVPRGAGSVAPDDPKRNIRKKFNGPSREAPSASPSFPLPCRSADAIRPFCNARRNPSKLPSSPPEPSSLISALPVKLRASDKAWWSSPINVAAVAAAATDNSLLSIAA